MSWSPYPPCRTARVLLSVFRDRLGQEPPHRIYADVLVIGTAAVPGSDHPYAGRDPMMVVEDRVTGRRFAAAASVLQ